MRIKLSENWTLNTFDSRNLSLSFKETGMGFFSNLESALDSYLNQRIISLEAENIQELLKKIEELKKELSEALKPLNLGVLIVSKKTPYNSRLDDYPKNYGKEAQGK